MSGLNPELRRRIDDTARKASTRQLPHVPRDACPHRLPLSNGWQATVDVAGRCVALYVRCDHCRALVDALHDGEFLRRYEHHHGYRPPYRP